MFLTQMAQRLQDGRPLTRQVDEPHPAADVPTTSGDHPAHEEPTSDRRDRSAAALAQGGADSGRRWLRGALPEPAAALIQQRADQTADNLSVSNAVSSLRAIADADWSDIIAQTSTLMQVMLRSEVFAAEDNATRDHSLHRIERLSRRSGRSEVEVATALIGLMQADVAVAGDAANTEASHWLRGDGRARLLSSLGLHGQVAHIAPFLLRHLALPAYLAAVLGLTFAWVAAVVGHPLWMALAPGAGVASGIAAPGLALLTGLAAVLMLFPASEAAVALVHRLISESVRPHHMARLAFAAGIPPEHRVLVVIPTLLTDERSTAVLVHRLHLHHLANPERHAQFALLTDWADADARELPADASLLDDALRQVRDLNARCSTGAASDEQDDPADPNASAAASTAQRFIVLHREREFSDTEQRWIGRERKRGKLEALIARIATGTPGPFMDQGELSRIAPGTKYVLTLDSDTRLPPGQLRVLVGVAAHPHHAPQLAADGRRVVSGHAILQPRLVTPLPDAATLTPFHQLFAGQTGIDPYSAATSEVYQDVFSEGSFTGKGLLNVQAVHAVLGGRLPVEQVLSHDLLEGAIARCAMVTDVTLIEDAPFHADVAASRVHRWTRGDWQLIGWLWPRWRSRESSTPTTDEAHGDGERPTLGAINRWKLLDNLRRSLVAPTSLALMLLSLASGVVSPWSALLVVMAAVAAGPLMGALAACTPSRDDVALGHFYRQAGSDFARALGGAAWMLVQLPAHAIAATDAIVRTLWRLAVSRRHLLQCTTASVA
jgi:cyclic beta-1,2-glucan synthetase